MGPTSAFSTLMAVHAHKPCGCTMAATEASRGADVELVRVDGVVVVKELAGALQRLQLAQSLEEKPNGEAHSSS